MNKLIDYIKKLVIDKFYGRIEISFEAGNITSLKEIKSIDTKQFKEVKG